MRPERSRVGSDCSTVAGALPGRSVALVRSRGYGWRCHTLAVRLRERPSAWPADLGSCVGTSTTSRLITNPDAGPVHGRSRPGARPGARVARRGMAFASLRQPGAQPPRWGPRSVSEGAFKGAFTSRARQDAALRRTLGARTGGIWGEAERLEDNASALSYPKVRMDASGNAIAVWAKWSEAYASRYVAGSGWGSVSIIGDNSAPHGSAINFPQVALDPLGNAIAT
jgi:hypothetical protein